MTRILAVLVVAAALAGIALLGGRSTGEPPKTTKPADPAPARVLDPNGPLGQPGGFYFTRVHERAFEKHDVSCLMLSPLALEPVPEWTPAGFVLRSEARSRIDEFCRAVGEAPPPFARVWAQVRGSRGAEGPPLRIFVRSYARPELPGRCVTAAIAFYTVPDPYVGRPDYGPWAGALFDVRKTYQLAGGTARLIEASIEAHTEVGRGAMREPLAQLAGDKSADVREVAHFEQYGAGRRHAWLWIDRSHGAAEEPEAFAREVIAVLGQGARRIDSKPLPAGAIEALLAFVERA